MKHQCVKGTSSLLVFQVPSWVNDLGFHAADVDAGLRLRSQERSGRGASHSLDPTESPARRFRPDASWLIAGLCVLVVIAILPRRCNAADGRFIDDQESKRLRHGRRGHERRALRLDSDRDRPRPKQRAVRPHHRPGQRHGPFTLRARASTAPRCNSAARTLVSASWQVTISDAVVGAFSDAGAPPSPPSTVKRWVSRAGRSAPFERSHHGLESSARRLGTPRRPHESGCRDLNPGPQRPERCACARWWTPAVNSGWSRGDVHDSGRRRTSADAPWMCHARG